MYVCFMLYVLCFRNSKDQFRKLTNPGQEIPGLGLKTKTSRYYRKFTKKITSNKYVTINKHNDLCCHVTRLVTDTWKYEDRRGKDSRGLTHTGLVVKQVLSVRNPKLLREYREAKTKLEDLQTMHLPEELQQQPILTSTLNDKDHNSDVELEAASLQCCVNLDPSEVYLFHGTKLEFIPGILENGFDLKRSCTGLYGKAIYLAENSEKADQYSGRFCMMF